MRARRFAATPGDPPRAFEARRQRDATWRERCALRSLAARMRKNQRLAVIEHDLQLLRRLHLHAGFRDMCEPVEIRALQIPRRGLTRLARAGERAERQAAVL